FVADRPGTGTTLLLSERGGPLAPRFGIGSADAHGESAKRVGDGLDSLRCDVDTVADLRLACDIGVGARTARVAHLTCGTSPEFTTRPLR
ncbi:MAG: 2-phospho-L-lactate guanylyltransferase, partial [Actinomycetota bacterium]|nr:2-phospho-L-lactate guanylyltransferase [Actinomycetota bacterium]